MVSFYKICWCWSDSSMIQEIFTFAMKYIYSFIFITVVFPICRLKRVEEGCGKWKMWKEKEKFRIFRSVSFRCRGKEIFWVSSVGSMSRCHRNEGESRAMIVVGGPYILRKFLGLLSVRHLWSCTSFAVWSMGCRRQNEGEIGAVVLW